MSALRNRAQRKGKQTDPATISPQKRAAAERKRRRAEIAAHPVGRLSFVETRPNASGRDFWAVHPTGDYRQDSAIGRAIADEALEYVVEHEGGKDGWLFQA